jgi:hypothetical protein
MAIDLTRSIFGYRFLHRRNTEVSAMRFIVQGHADHLSVSVFWKCYHTAVNYAQRHPRMYLLTSL